MKSKALTTRIRCSIIRHRMPNTSRIFFYLPIPAISGVSLHFPRLVEVFGCAAAERWRMGEAARAAEKQHHRRYTR